MDDAASVQSGPAKLVITENTYITDPKEYGEVGMNVVWPARAVALAHSLVLDSSQRSQMLCFAGLRIQGSAGAVCPTKSHQRTLRRVSIRSYKGIQGDLRHLTV